MVGHRLWNQEACNWHCKQGLSGPDSWVCLEQPLYSPTHFSSHFLISQFHHLFWFCPLFSVGWNLRFPAGLKHEISHRSET
jgi:hypothetical protein